MNWISVKERLPIVGDFVIVYTTYIYEPLVSGSSKISVTRHDTFIGYMDEDSGDLMVCPTDENYGWPFAECVEYWMPITVLPEQPKETT